MSYAENQTLSPANVIAAKLINDRMFEAYIESTILNSLPLYKRREVEASLDAYDENPNAPASRLGAIVKECQRHSATLVGGGAVSDAEEIVLDCAEDACVEIMAAIRAKS